MKLLSNMCAFLFYYIAVRFKQNLPSLIFSVWVSRGLCECATMLCNTVNILWYHTEEDSTEKMKCKQMKSSVKFWSDTV